MVKRPDFGEPGFLSPQDGPRVRDPDAPPRPVDAGRTAPEAASDAPVRPAAIPSVPLSGVPRLLARAGNALGLLRKVRLLRTGWLVAGAVAVAALATFIVFVADRERAATVAVFGVIGAGILALLLWGWRARPVSQRKRMGTTGLAIALVILTAGVGGPQFATGDRPRAAEPSSTPGDELRKWRGYPLSAEVPNAEVLNGMSYEQYAARADELLAELRAELTAAFGFEWVMRREATPSPCPNGYGGSSLLHDYQAPVWQTTTTVTNVEDKQRVMDIISAAMERNGIGELDLVNEPRPWKDPEELASLYGGETLDTQDFWVLTGESILPRGWFAAGIVDLSQDVTGDVGLGRSAYDELYGLAPEGVHLRFSAEAMMREGDRQRIMDALKPFAGMKKPKAV